MTLGSESATAMAPPELVLSWPSEMGSQDPPPSVVFHTPPPPPPKEETQGCGGTPVTAIARPPRNGPTRRKWSDWERSGVCALNKAGRANKRASRRGFIVWNGIRKSGSYDWG